MKDGPLVREAVQHRGRLISPLLLAAQIAGLTSASGAPSEQEARQRQIGIMQAMPRRETPSLNEMKLIEDRLDRSRCVGDIKRWTRRYAYGLDSSQHFSTRVVEFDYRRFYRQNKGARVAVLFKDWMDLEERQMYLVGGTYFLDTHKLAIRSCGLNHPDQLPNWQIPGLPSK